MKSPVMAAVGLFVTILSAIALSSTAGTPGWTVFFSALLLVGCFEVCFGIGRREQ